jgi:hypothetical protein
MKEAIRMTGWSWPEERVYIQIDAKDEEEQQQHSEQARIALNQKVMADLNTNFWKSVFVG